MSEMELLLGDGAEERGTSLQRASVGLLSLCPLPVFWLKQVKFPLGDTWLSLLGPVISPLGQAPGEDLGTRTSQHSPLHPLATVVVREERVTHDAPEIARQRLLLQFQTMRFVCLFLCSLGLLSW